MQRNADVHVQCMSLYIGVHALHGVQELCEMMWGWGCVYEAMLRNTVNPQTSQEVHAG